MASISPPSSPRSQDASMTPVNYSVADVFRAIERGDLPTLQAAVDSLAPQELERKNAGGDTPLHCAVKTGQEPFVRCLLEAHANPSSEDVLLATPLHHAARVGSIEIVRTLLAFRANARERDKDGNLPMHWAMEGGEIEVVRLLVEVTKETIEYDQINDIGETPLYQAARKGLHEIVEVLLQAGFDSRGDWWNQDRIPLHVAAKEGHLETVKVLIRYKVNVNTSDHEVKTALHLARTKEIAEALLNAGALLEAEDRNRRTPLSYAVSHQEDTQLAEFLLGREADAKVKDTYSYTLLHSLAWEGGHPGHVQLLIDAGVPLHAKREFAGRETALRLAVQRGHLDIVKALIECGADLYEPSRKGEDFLFLAVRARAFLLVDWLLDKQFNPNMRDDSGQTLLHYLASVMHWTDPADWNTTVPRMARRLMRKGADVMLQDEKGRIPLHLAVLNGNEPLVEEFLNRGADPLVCDSDGFTPLELARTQLEEAIKWKRKGEIRRRERIYQLVYKASLARFASPIRDTTKLPQCLAELAGDFLVGPPLAELKAHFLAGPPPGKA